MISASISQLQPIVLRLMKAGCVPFIHGKPGTGKSALAQWVARRLKLKLIDVRLAETDPCELQGFPFVDKDTMTARYVPLDLFPTKTTPVPEGYNGWLVLFDEFSSAPKAVQSAAYKILLDRKIGQEDLHPNVLMMAAGNLATDGAVVEPQSSAITSRTANITVLDDYNGWCEWAAKAGVDHRITSYIRFKPVMMHTLNPDLPEEPYACGRTWEMLSRCIKGVSTLNNDDEIIAGSLIGEGIAREFAMFARIYGELPSIPEIVKSPKTVPMSDRLDIRWALMGSICNHITEGTFEPLTEYLDRMPAELRVVAMKEMFQRHPDLYELDAAQEWLNRTADEVC